MITVAIATHPPRMGPDGPYERAVASASQQTLPPAGGVVVALDVDSEGAAATRNRALDMVKTEWVAFLDSDDRLYPNHLRACMRHATLAGADVVYPGYDVEGGEDPVNCFGVAFDATLLRRRNFIPVTVLARTDVVRAAGGFQVHPDSHGNPCEDWGLWLALLDAGATFSHLPQRTWVWSLGTGTHQHPPVEAA